MSNIPTEPQIPRSIPGLLALAVLFLGLGGYLLYMLADRGPAGVVDPAIGAQTGDSLPTIAPPAANTPELAPELTSAAPAETMKEALENAETETPAEATETKEIAEEPTEEAVAPPAAAVTLALSLDSGRVRAEEIPADSASAEPLDAQVRKLHQKFDQLQETLSQFVDARITDLERENETLRAELKRLQARDAAGMLSSANVPRPGREVIAQLAEEAVVEASQPERNIVREETLQRLQDTDPGNIIAPPVEFTFEVLREWGREKSDVEQLGGKAPTLKGIIGLVQPGSQRADLEQLGLDLREEYADYDNINIEVFDDPTAAAAYVATQEINEDHRVLTVSKHTASGRDLVLYYDDGGSHTVQSPGGPKVSTNKR